MVGRAVRDGCPSRARPGTLDKSHRPWSEGHPSVTARRSPRDQRRIRAQYRHEEALVLLDQGRGVPWAQQLGSRTDVDRLAGHDPGRATRAGELLRSLGLAQEESERHPALRTTVSAWTRPN